MGSEDVQSTRTALALLRPLDALAALRADPDKWITKEGHVDRISYSGDFQEKGRGLFSGDGRVVDILGHRRRGLRPGFLGSSPQYVSLTCCVILSKSLNLSEAQDLPP